MELRYVVICDINGVKTKPSLQFREWNDDDEYWSNWVDIPLTEVKFEGKMRDLDIDTENELIK